MNTRQPNMRLHQYTETTINDTRDFGISKRLTNLPALRQVGFPANRRLLAAQRISHDPIRGAAAFTELTAPITTGNGYRIPGLRFGDPRVHALLQALLVHRLLPRGFTNRDLRTLTAPLLGRPLEDITAGTMTYDLRRLRVHGLIQRIPHTRRYRVTDLGLQQALLSPTPTTICCAPDWPNSATPARPGRPGCAPPPAPTRPPSTTWPSRHTSRPDPPPTDPDPTHAPHLTRSRTVSRPKPSIYGSMVARPSSAMGRQTGSLGRPGRRQQAAGLRSWLCTERGRPLTPARAAVR
jgi:hypothetical protein